MPGGTSESENAGGLDEQRAMPAHEKLSDIAHNLERWVDVIVLRTFAQETIEGMAQHASIPVINK